MSLKQYHIIKLLQKNAATSPDSIALEGFDSASNWKSVTWKSFENKSSKLSQVLIESGFKIQDKAVILAQNCPQWTLVDVGVLKARGIVVPVYPTSTLEQAAYIINDAQAKVIFVNDKQQYRMACELEALCPSIETIIVFDANVNLKAEARHHYLLDDYLQHQVSSLSRAESQHRLDNLQLDDLVTLIYTSGTTGDPKGVMLDYRNFASTVRQHDSLVDFTKNDTSLAFLPLSHVFERGWSFYVLCRGGRNVYLSDTNNIKEALQIVKPNTLCVVPRFLEKIYCAVMDKLSKTSVTKKGIFSWALNTGNKSFLINQGQKQANLLTAVSHKLAQKLVFNKLAELLGGRIKFMPCGGAALAPEVAHFFQSVGIPILCGYGMTETTATVTCCTMENRLIGSNGKVMPELAVKIGENDEIMVKGDTVMRGYYNRPQETADTFTDGWLKTGDAGFLDADGNLFITDRIKELMKTSNGKYIAPQRVEGTVGCCPFIEQVAIVADARNYVTALIVPAFEALEQWAKEKGVKYESPIELIRHSHVLEHFELRLKAMQKNLAGFEKIKKFTLLPEAFSMESGLITPTMKLRRKVIYGKYANEINAMYSH